MYESNYLSHLSVCYFGQVALLGVYFLSLILYKLHQVPIVHVNVIWREDWTKVSIVQIDYLLTLNFGCWWIAICWWLKTSRHANRGDWRWRRVSKAAVTATIQPLIIEIK